MLLSFGQVLVKVADIAPLSEKSNNQVHKVIGGGNLSWGIFCAKFIFKQYQEVCKMDRFDFNLVRPGLKIESGNRKMNICKY